MRSNILDKIKTEVIAVQTKTKRDAQLEQNKREKPMSVLAKVALIGFIGGVFWSFLAYCAYFFHFTEVAPNFILQPWAVGDWKNGALGQTIAILFIGIVSVVAAFVYYAFFKNRQGIWPGVAFGIGLWVLVFYVLNPIFPQLKAVPQLERNTVVTMVCFYILYGVFIGYSISFEVTEMRRQKQADVVK
ncbi:YqhR family membrane protein [Anoxybacillus pushchinoensis]|uniref:YqhR family membrane protein n=1 Tax=Anoxybacillus pushchinoensis TaxID=150248 RepID=UPI000B865D02|nr:YqhR family membrane protein [Anoxybacillus pushchinoensis]